jgi:probable phosphoglycerate mutase
MFLGALSQQAGCINALDVGVDERDWVLRFMNFAPPAPLQADTRSTTMEQLYDQYRKSR